MSKPINDMQLYVLIWCAKDSRTGGFSELHYPGRQGCSWTEDGIEKRIDHPERTAFDRAQMLGLAKRGFLHMRGQGLWYITDAGRAELERPAIAKRVAAMLEAGQKSYDKRCGR